MEVCFITTRWRCTIQCSSIIVYIVLVGLLKILNQIYALHSLQLLLLRLCWCSQIEEPPHHIPCSFFSCGCAHRSKHPHISCSYSVDDCVHISGYRRTTTFFALASPAVVLTDRRTPTFLVAIPMTVVLT